MHTCTHVCTETDTDTHTRAVSRKHIYIHTCALGRARVHVRVRVRVRVHVRVRVRVRVDKRLMLRIYYIFSYHFLVFCFFWLLKACCRMVQYVAAVQCVYPFLCAVENTCAVNKWNSEHHHRTHTGRGRPVTN